MRGWGRRMVQRKGGKKLTGDEEDADLFRDVVVRDDGRDQVGGSRRGESCEGHPASAKPRWRWSAAPDLLALSTRRPAKPVRAQRYVVFQVCGLRCSLPLSVTRNSSSGAAGAAASCFSPFSCAPASRSGSAKVVVEWLDDVSAMGAGREAEGAMGANGALRDDAEDERWRESPAAACSCEAVRASDSPSNIV